MFVALIALAAAVTPEAPTATTAGPPASTPPPTGPTAAADPVLTSIAAQTDCAALQQAFDQADTNHDAAINRDSRAAAERTVDIMKAADARLQQLDCQP